VTGFAAGGGFHGERRLDHTFLHDLD
jgi:hypothetical protein